MAFSIKWKLPFPAKKAWRYAVERLCAVMALWLAAGCVVASWSALGSALSANGRAPAKAINLGIFVDYRLLILLVISLALVMLALTLVISNTTPNTQDNEKVLRFIGRLWDEISAAATHAGAALTAVEAFRLGGVWEEHVSWPIRSAVIGIYFAVGVLAYRHDPNNAQGSPAAGGKPGPGTGPANAPPPGGP